MARDRDRPHNKSQLRRERRDRERVVERTRAAAESKLTWRQLPRVLSNWNQQPERTRTQAGNKLVQIFAWLIAIVLAGILGWMLYYGRFGVADSSQAQVGETRFALRQLAVERDLQRWRALSELNLLAAATPEFAEYEGTEDTDRLARSFFAADDVAVDRLVNRQLLFDQLGDDEYPALAEYQALLAEYVNLSTESESNGLARSIGVEPEQLTAHLRGQALLDRAVAQARAAVPVETDQARLLIVRSSDRDLLEGIAARLEAGERDQVVAEDAEDEGYTVFDFGWSVRERVAPEYVDSVWEQEVGSTQLFTVEDASDILFLMEEFQELRPIDADTLGQLQDQSEDRFYIELRSSGEWSTEDLSPTAETWLGDNGIPLPPPDERVTQHYGIAL